MKRIINSILFLFAITIFLTSNVFAGGDIPKIIFSELTHDFRKVEAGTMLEYSFSFTNVGNKPLLIEKVQPSCGCTGANIGDKYEYYNGESGKIKITFNTQGRQGNSTKTVTVYSNDPENPVITLNFKCEIEDK